MSRVQCCQSEHEEFDVTNTAELSPESFDFRIEGFRRCIGEPPLEIVHYCGVVDLESLQYFVEFIISESFHFVVPSGEVQSGDSGSSFLVEYVHKLQKQRVCLFQVWELPEQYPGAYSLLIVPFGFVFEYDISAARHNLRHAGADVAVRYSISYSSVRPFAVFPKWSSIRRAIRHLVRTNREYSDETA